MVDPNKTLNLLNYIHFINITLTFYLIDNIIRDYMNYRLTFVTVQKKNRFQCCQKKSFKRYVSPRVKVTQEILLYYFLLCNLLKGIP